MNFKIKKVFILVTLLTISMLPLSSINTSIASDGESEITFSVCLNKTDYSLFQNSYFQIPTSILQMPY